MAESVVLQTYRAFRSEASRVFCAMLRRLIVLGLTLVAFAGCESPPVEWRDPVAIARPSPTARLVVDTTGSVRYVADSVHLAGLPPEAMQCTPSVTAAVGTVHTFAVWWAVRRGGTTCTSPARCSRPRARAFSSRTPWARCFTPPYP